MDIEKVESLDSLADEIRAKYASAIAQANKSREFGNEAVKDALLCGLALNQAKALVGHGKWLTWLAANCDGVSLPTANRWMRIANSSHMINLNDAISLRQAYIACGIIPEPEHGAGSTQQKPIYMRLLDRIPRVASWFKPDAVEQWPKDKRAELKQELKPIVDVYERL